jgi:murein DD-endopeptidase MepM/ murein hydrolase activator NlpD
MFASIKLNSTLGRSYNVDPDDVLKMKQILKTLGFYEVPTYGMTPYPDEPLFEAIEAFQKTHGLSRDGIMKLDGETEIAVNEKVALAGGPDGRVQVDAYTQNRDGETVGVASHTRSAPGSGASTESQQISSSKPPPMKPPVHNAKVREVDGYGSGEFGARRKRPDGSIYHHEGVDIVTTPGETVFSPVDGTYVEPAKADDDPRYSGAFIKTGDGAEVKIFYIKPVSGLKRGDKVEAGKTPIGTAQDIAPKYPPRNGKPMTNHAHIQVKKDGKAIDPTGPLTGRK